MPPVSAVGRSSPRPRHGTPGEDGPLVVGQHRERGVAVLEPRGPLTAGTADRFTGVVDALAPDREHVVVDLTRTTALDGEGVRALLRAAREVRGRDGWFRVAGVDGDVGRTLRGWRGAEGLGGTSSPAAEVSRAVAHRAAQAYFAEE